MDERIAECGCGRLKVRVSGEPLFVAACHCDFCQKHTGSAFRLSSFFRADQIMEITGDRNTYNGLEIDGVGIGGSDEYGTTYYFCGTCGSTVYWRGDLVPGAYGIAVGSFVAPDFAPPTTEVWTELRHHWLAPIPNAEALERFS
jgi:hypothetical protein